MYIMSNIEMGEFCFDPVFVKIEQDITTTIENDVEIQLQDCCQDQNVEDIMVNDGHSENSDSSTNMITDRTDFTFTQSAGIVSDDFHNNTSIKQLVDKNFIKSLKSNFNQRIEDKLHRCCDRDNNFIKSVKSNFNKHNLHACLDRDNNLIKRLKSSLNEHIRIVKIEEDIATINKNDVEIQLQDCCQDQNVEDIMINDGHSENGDSSINMITDSTDFTFTQSAGIVSDEFHNNTSIKQLVDRNFIKSLKSNFNQHIEDKSHGCFLCSIHGHIEHKKPHICNFCCRSFNQKSDLSKHIITHAGGCYKPYECEFCGKSFYYKSYLRRHIRTHAAEKPY